MTRYTKNTLVYIYSFSLSLGVPADITTTSNYIIALTKPTGSDGAIYKIDPVTFSIISFANLGSDLWLKAKSIDDTFIALGGNIEVGVFNISTMEMIDVIDAPTPIGVHNDTKEMIIRSG